MDVPYKSFWTEDTLHEHAAEKSLLKELLIHVNT